MKSNAVRAITGNVRESAAIMLVGDWRFDIYEPAIEAGLKAHGAVVCRHCFWAGITEFYAKLPRWLARKFMYLEHRVNWGAYCDVFNRELLNKVGSYKYDAVFLYNARYIRARTLREIKRRSPGVKVFLYTNDNPFGLYRFPWLVWRHYIASIRIADTVFVYRESNIAPCKAQGAQAVELLRSYYVEGKERPCPVDHPKLVDVVFIGHYEADGRLAVLEALISAGLKVAVYGDQKSWSLAKSELLDVKTIHPVYGEEYVRKLHDAKCALVFLSKINQDDYTRRNFEIPACRVVMLSERTARLSSLFGENNEALYFQSPGEAVKAAIRVSSQSEFLEQIANAGYNAVINQGHSNVARASSILSSI